MLLKKLIPTSWPTWLDFFRQCLLLTVAMLGAIWLKKGFSYDSQKTLWEAALLFGLLSGTCYRVILTTEIQLFVERISFFNVFLNAGLLYLISKILPAFQIEHFSTAFWAGVLINVITWTISAASLFAPAVIKKNSSPVKQARAKVIGTRTTISSDENQRN